MNQTHIELFDRKRGTKTSGVTPAALPHGTTMDTARRIADAAKTKGMNLPSVFRKRTQ